MWNSPTRVEDRFALGQDRRKLADSVIAHLKISKEGVLVVFETEDLSGYFSSRWRKPAVYMDIKEGGIEGISPEHLLKIMKNRDYRHLIWISRQVCESSSDVYFAWVLAHELGHLMEDLLSPVLSKAGYFLEHTLFLIDIEEPRLTLTLPSEMYADLTALRTVRDLFSDKDVSDYLQAERKSKVASQQCIDLMLEEEQRGDFDVVAKTVFFLQKYRDKLDATKSKLDTDVNIQEFEIDTAVQELVGIRQRRFGGHGL